MPRKRHLEEATSAKEVVFGKESGTYEYELSLMLSVRDNVRPHCPLAVPHAAAPFEACCARLPGDKALMSLKRLLSTEPEKHLGQIIRTAINPALVGLEAVQEWKHRLHYTILGFRLPLCHTSPRGAPCCHKQHTGEDAACPCCAHGRVFEPWLRTALLVRAPL